MESGTKRKFTQTHITKNSTPIAQQYSSLIRVYQLNFVENLFFLLDYTGMTRKDFKKRMSNENIKNGLLVAYEIKKNTLLGFDIICIGVLAHIFRLPTSLLLNYKISELEGFVPEEYGLYRNMYKKNSRLKGREEHGIVPKEEAVFKRMVYRKAKADSDFPSGIFDLWSFVK
jgi:hypothetical protein